MQRRGRKLTRLERLDRNSRKMAWCMLSAANQALEVRLELEVKAMMERGELELDQAAAMFDTLAAQWKDRVGDIDTEEHKWFTKQMELERDRIRASRGIAIKPPPPPEGETNLTVSSPEIT